MSKRLVVATMPPFYDAPMSKAFRTAFLGLEPLRSVRSKDRNIVPYERAMNWEEKVFLYNLFAEDIAKVEQLLGWNCGDWKL